MSRYSYTQAWAPVGKKTGKVLCDLDGRYAIYTHRKAAQADCPNYGVVRRVRVRVIVETRRDATPSPMTGEKNG